MVSDSAATERILECCIMGISIQQGLLALIEQINKAWTLRQVTAQYQGIDKKAVGR